jgi:hypothetical protein
MMKRIGWQQVWSHIPWGLLGMLPLVFGVERYIAWHEVDFSDAYAANAKYGANAAMRIAPKCDLLFFGDSLVKMGVAPQIFESQLGLRTTNLSVVGSQPPAAYFLLRRALKSGAHPKAVLVDFKANCVACSPKFNERQWPEMLSVRELVELAWTMHDASFLGLLVSGRLVPSIKCRREIRNDVLCALRGESPPSRSYLPIFWRNWNRNQGAQLMPKNPEARNDPRNVDPGAFYPPAWTCDPACNTYIRRFIALAASHNIPVYWLLPPIKPDVQVKREQLGLDGLYLRLVRYHQSQFPNLIVLDGRHSGFDETMFQDGSHLDRDGATAFSAAVAQVLRDQLSAGKNARPRWVALPSDHSRPPKVPIEDFEESKIAVQLDLQRRRL